MKNKNLKKSLLLLAITSIMLFAMSITASADTDMNIQQTDGSTGSVNISWNASVGNHYHVQVSTDGGASWKDYDETSSPSMYIYELSQGSSYWVRVVVYSGKYHNSSKDGALVDTSNPVVVKTKCAKVGKKKVTSQIVSSASVS